MKPLPEWIISYLNRMRLEPQEPDFPFLQKICRSHMQVFPYENVSKLIFFEQKSSDKLVPTPEEYVANAVRYDMGGTCFANNGSLLALLRALGYRGHLMPLSPTHMAILIQGLLPNDEPVYVDMGAAAPMLIPVALHSAAEHENAFGFESVRIVRDPVQPERFRFLRFRLGELVSDKWNFDPSEAKEIHDFSDSVALTFQPDATYMGCLRIQLYQVDRGRSLSLLNNSLQIMRENGTEEKILLHSPEDLEAVVAEEFGLPRLPVREAMAILLKKGIDVFAPQD